MSYCLILLYMLERLPKSFFSIDVLLAQVLSLNYKIASFTAGRRFYAHRICLLASSDAFRAMFDGGYRVSCLCVLSWSPTPTLQSSSLLYLCV